MKPILCLLIMTFLLLHTSSCKTTENTSKINDHLIEAKEYSIREWQDMMASGSATAVSIVEYYIHRIEKLDADGPTLNSIIEMNPDALEIAKSLDEERQNGKVRGPLHGIPILIKDNIDTGDKMQTTAGSLALVGHHARDDAFIVEKLRAAGAVILGKTNLSEWANFRSTHSTSAWSSRGGQTVNPYVLTQNPCGSSSGSGVAVAADLCTVSIGTETDGSVTCPAAVNGVVGFKPSIGLVSRDGIIPISHTQDTAGPIGRSVEDVAILLNAIVGYDPQDMVTLEAQKFKNIDFTSLLDKKYLLGKRIGMDKSVRSADEKLNKVLDQIESELIAAGAIIVDVPYKSAVNENGTEEFTFLMYEFKDGLNKYLSSSDARYKTLEEIIAFNLSNKESAMPHFQQEILVQSQAKEGLDSDEYQHLYKKIHLGTQAILDSLMSAYNIDALIGMTIGPGTKIDYEKGDVWADLYTPPAAAMAGYPHITVPAGYTDGLPIGISIFSGYGKDAEVIAMGYAYEQATLHRISPGYKASMDK